MSRFLRKSELCPIHHSYICACHGGNSFRRGRFQVAVEILEDQHHPRGYRELCSDKELRRRKHILLERHPYCFYCGEKLTDYGDVELAHKRSKGMAGQFRDDHWDNIAVSHRSCNRENGSKNAEEEVA